MKWTKVLNLTHELGITSQLSFSGGELFHRRFLLVIDITNDDVYIVKYSSQRNKINIFAKS